MTPDLCECSRWMWKRWLRGPWWPRPSPPPATCGWAAVSEADPRRPGSDTWSCTCSGSGPTWTTTTSAMTAPWSAGTLVTGVSPGPVPGRRTATSCVVRETRMKPAGSQRQLDPVHGENLHLQANAGLCLLSLYHIIHECKILFLWFVYWRQSIACLHDDVSQHASCACLKEAGECFSSQFFHIFFHEIYLKK